MATRHVTAGRVIPAPATLPIRRRGVSRSPCSEVILNEGREKSANHQGVTAPRIHGFAGLQKYLGIVHMICPEA